MIECVDINKSFHQKAVLQDVSITINNNKITSLIGSNGAGKSTLIGVILGYYNLNSGTIRKNTTSVMPDADSLYSDMTGYEFLSFMSGLKKLPSNELALSLAKDLKIEKDLTKKIDSYSFGMKKKISFIQACIGSYDSYIFDEPTSGVDEPSAIKMLDIVQNLKKNGAAILLTSHNLDELERISDYIYIIDKGKIVNEGTVNTIITSKNTSDNFIYILKTSNTKKAFQQISSSFDIKISILNDSEIEMEVEDDTTQLGEILYTLLENNITFSEVYKEKRSLRESVYTQ